MWRGVDGALWFPVSPNERPSVVWQWLVTRLRRVAGGVRSSGASGSGARAGRRAFLTGRLGEFLPSDDHRLVARYPRPEAKGASGDEPRSIAGISIEPVAPTSLGEKSPAQTVPVFRPPGAIEEPQFLARCTRCGDCIDACPHDAIRTATQRYGLGVEGTPVIEPDTQACLMCEDFPCIASCEPGVLSKNVPPVMGTAVVTEHLCLAHHHTTCTVCSERCPVPGAISVEAGKPTVNEATCTGCGVCRYVCPAPENAILLMPAFARPAEPPQ